LTPTALTPENAALPTRYALMPPFDTLATFLAISVLITLSPGPDNLMVLSYGLSGGRRSALGIACGCALGCFTHTLWASLGVSAALAAQPTLLTLLKVTGAAYLAWLGIQALRNARVAQVHSHSIAQSAQTWGTHVRRGFVANAINPKVALFFLAFLPQFTQQGDTQISLQLIALGTLFSVQTLIVFGAIALLSGTIGGLLARHEHASIWLDRMTGGLLLALALRLAFDRTTL